MPAVLRLLSYLMPLRYYLVIIRSLLLKDVGLEIIRTDVISHDPFCFQHHDRRCHAFPQALDSIPHPNPLLKERGDNKEISMNHKRPPLPAIIIVALLVIVSIYFIVTQVLTDKDGALTASGTIEAVQVNVAPEIAGKVIEVLADEGQPVSKRQLAASLDPSLLTAQRAVAVAGLESAKAGAQTAQSALATAQSQYQIALEAALAQDKKARIQDWFSKDPNRFEQPDWYFSRTEQLQSAHDQVDIAFKALEDAQQKFGECQHIC